MVVLGGMKRDMALVLVSDVVVVVGGGDVCGSGGGGGVHDLAGVGVGVVVFVSVGAGLFVLVSDVWIFCGASGSVRVWFGCVDFGVELV